MDDFTSSNANLTSLTPAAVGFGFGALMPGS